MADFELWQLSRYCALSLLWTLQRGSLRYDNVFSTCTISWATVILSIKASVGPSNLSATIIHLREQLFLASSLHHAAQAVLGTFCVVQNWTLAIVEDSVSVITTSSTAFNLFRECLLHLPYHHFSNHVAVTWRTVFAASTRLCAFATAKWVLSIILVYSRALLVNF